MLKSEKTLKCQNIQNTNKHVINARRDLVTSVICV